MAVVLCAIQILRCCEQSLSFSHETLVGGMIHSTSSMSGVLSEAIRDEMS
jgi:hypothetical protein